MATRFRIDLTKVHAATGLSAYEVAKRVGMNRRTVGKYVQQVVIAEMLPYYIKDLADFYGVPLDDVVEYIEVDTEDQESVLATPA